MNVDFLPGNRVDLLENGRDFFPALIEAIAQARCEVCLETYIFADDPASRAVVEALGAAARRGVAVRVLVDGFGARDFPGGLGADLLAAGVQLRVYRPEVSRLRLQRNRLRRLHRKIAVIDVRIAFVGGINIIDDYNNAGKRSTGPRFDYAVAVEGPLVKRIHAQVVHLWQLVGWAQLRRRPPAITPVPCGSDAPAGTTTAAFVVRDNFRHRRDIEEAYLSAIGSAKKEVLMANAYFLPGRRFRHALLDASARGVRVSLLLQGRVEYALFHYATQALYFQLLQGGIHIHEYQSGFLHAKVAVIDDDWATVGSSNIDPLSLLVAREANVVVENADFAGRLRESLRQAIAVHAREIDLDDLDRSGLVVRILRWAAYGLVRLMLGITRYGGADYRA